MVIKEAAKRGTNNGPAGGPDAKELCLSHMTRHYLMPAK